MAISSKLKKVARGVKKLFSPTAVVDAFGRLRHKKTPCCDRCQALEEQKAQNKKAFLRGVFGRKANKPRSRIVSGRSTTTTIDSDISGTWTVFSTETTIVHPKPTRSLLGTGILGALESSATHLDRDPVYMSEALDWVHATDILLSGPSDGQGSSPSDDRSSEYSVISPDDVESTKETSSNTASVDQASVEASSHKISNIEGRNTTNAEDTLPEETNIGATPAMDSSSVYSDPFDLLTDFASSQPDLQSNHFHPAHEFALSDENARYASEFTPITKAETAAEVMDASSRYSDSLSELSESVASGSDLRNIQYSPANEVGVFNTDAGSLKAGISTAVGGKEGVLNRKLSEDGEHIWIENVPIYSQDIVADQMSHEHSEGVHQEIQNELNPDAVAARVSAIFSHAARNYQALGYDTDSEASDAVSASGDNAGGFPRKPVPVNGHRGFSSAQPIIAEHNTGEARQFHPSLDEYFAVTSPLEFFHDNNFDDRDGVTEGIRFGHSYMGPYLLTVAEEDEEVKHESADKTSDTVATTVLEITANEREKVIEGPWMRWSIFMLTTS
ncbi:hypothetical protein B0T17DRAFT_652336 [Bombardia bombarda]|uniref:Uncharacterized protein n=1 Tax=Bombardia bombarda TaxID=252184 RepID=A0AA39X737_9PEZI|nr:hypothetical protein B0T17DRAFT_652336 [Bombardia bombarda]